MSKRKYLLAVSLGVIGALLMSATASADVTGISYTGTVSPKKQSAKTFGPAGINNNVETFYTAGFAPIPTQTVIQFSKDIKFTPGKTPQCNLSSISTVPDSTAMSVCGTSKVGQGSVLINNGALTGNVTAYNGVPSGGNPTINLHTDVFVHGTYSFSTTLNGPLNLSTNTLTVAIPPTGTSITHFDTAVNKIKTGKKKGKTTYFVMARCKKKWVNSATTTFVDGSTQSSRSVQKCKAKKSKKKKKK